MSPRLTDWSIALATLLAFVLGLISLVSGLPQEWIIFALHGIAGLWLLLLLWGKLRRVLPRLIHTQYWDRRTTFGALALLFVSLALGSGIWWVGGGEWFVAGLNLLNWHIALGFILTAAILFHMLVRFKWLRKRDIIGRRRILSFSTLLLGGGLLWPAQQVAQRTLTLPGAERRFTGSRESGSYAGNAFPTSSWVADSPRPLDTQTWQLAVGGAVDKPRKVSYDELASTNDVLEATLDCTGGFYSTQRWKGISISRLLQEVHIQRDARYVSFVSVTGYRWSLPLDEAKKALLATHVGEEVLSHEHGFPLRLVVPGRRGFEWVKWIVQVNVLTELDPGETVSIFISGFSDKGSGRR